MIDAGWRACNHSAVLPPAARTRTPPPLVRSRLPAPGLAGPARASRLAGSGLPGRLPLPPGRARRPCLGAGGRPLGPRPLARRSRGPGLTAALRGPRGPILDARPGPGRRVQRLPEHLAPVPAGDAADDRPDDR